MTARVPVLIVGGGPVGLALAGELGWRGVPCTLIEKTDGSIEQPKMDLVGIRTMEFCRRWGIVDWVRDAPYPLDYPQDYIYVTGLNGYELGREPFPGRGFEPCPPESPQKRERVPQDMFDPILRRFAERLGARDAAVQLRAGFVCRDAGRRAAPACATPSPERRNHRRRLHGRHRRRRQHRARAARHRHERQSGADLHHQRDVPLPELFRAARQGPGLPLHLHRPGGRVAHHRRGQRRRPLPHVDRRHAAEDQPHRGRHPRGAEARDGPRLRLRNPFGHALGAPRAGRRPLRHRPQFSSPATPRT